MLIDLTMLSFDSDMFALPSVWMVVKSGSAAKSLIKEQNTAEAEPKVVVENMEGGTKETAA